jgi:protein O-mannosyl-transferase
MSAAGLEVRRDPRSASSVRQLTPFANRPILVGLLLVLATVALYHPVHHHPFINYDDRDYVYENPTVESGLSLHTIRWSFTTYTARNWHPLTWLSHALDCQLFGLNPAGPHDVNVLFHALNAVLLFWVLAKATGYIGRSFMVAALFALHPINVESVAWVAERKNVLSMMFFLLALGAYRWYAARPRVGRYAIVAALFALGLMAKPQIITLPFVLLLWDYWPLERYAFRSPLFAFRQRVHPSLSGEDRIPDSGRRSSGEKRETKSQKRLYWLMLEKLPLLLIAAASAAITLKAQHAARNWFPRQYRVGNAILSYRLYIRKAFWPSRLALLYPHPDTSLSWSAVIVMAVLLVVITGFVVFMGRRHRYLPVGWFWFLGTLVPMLGIVQVGVQAMADRYAYMSFIGLFLMICWGAADWAGAKNLPAVLLPVTSLAVLLLLAIVARQQIAHWQSDEALWSHTLQVTTRNWMAESQMGTALAIEGKVAQAMPHFYTAIAIQPDDTNSQMAIAIYDLQQREYEDAIQHYQIAITDQNARPSLLAQAYRGLAKSYAALGDSVRAEQYLQTAKDVGNR